MVTVGPAARPHEGDRVSAPAVASALTSLLAKTRVRGLDLALEPASSVRATSTWRTRWGSTCGYGELASGRSNAFNQLTGITSSDGSTTSFGYDGNGNQTAKTVNPAGGTAQTTQYVYNDDNRLVGIALPNGQSDAFEYDANGLRTKKTDSNGTTRYLLDGLSVVAQYAPDGTKQAFYTQSLARIDEVLSVVNSQGKYWYQADALGSTYALADKAGNLAAQGGYDVFGAPVAVSGSVGQPFGFTGREHDLDSCLVYARARYLQPGAGRWTQPDPLGIVAGSNYYRYVRNDAVNLADPYGLGAMPLPLPPPPPPYPPPANEPMGPAPVFDTLTAYAYYHPVAFLFLMVDLGVISGAVLAKVAEDCDKNNDSLQEFWRGDSASRAWASVTGGFIAAGVGLTNDGQFGPGLYMSRERSVAVRYAKKYSPGAVVDILIRTSIWKAVVATGVKDGEPIAGEAGTQTWIPPGPGYELFDQASVKLYDEELN